MWVVIINPLVMKEDFAKINKNDQRIILKTIFKKLKVNPEGYGEPLKQGLKGFWKLKVSHYRIIYRIEKEEVLVLVLKIGLRRDDQVYREMLTRINKL